MLKAFHVPPFVAAAFLSIILFLNFEAARAADVSTQQAKDETQPAKNAATHVNEANESSTASSTAANSTANPPAADPAAANSTASSKVHAESSAAPAAYTPEKEQVQAWFSQYDQIRREAEMTMQQKFQAHSLFSKVAEGKKDALQNEKSEEFAQTMMDTYAGAASKIRNLPELAATVELQHGYEDFFMRSSKLFKNFISAKKKGNEKIASKEEVQAKREELITLDKKIKALDAKLRLKFGVKAHKHK